MQKSEGVWWPMESATLLSPSDLTEVIPFLSWRGLQASRPNDQREWEDNHSGAILKFTGKIECTYPACAEA